MEYQYRRYLLKLRYANVNDVPRGIKTQYKDSVKFREYVVHGNIVRDVLKTGKLVLIVVVGIPKVKGQAGWKIEEDQILSMLGPHLEDEKLRICPEYEPKERDKKDMHILDTPLEAQRTGNYNSGVTSGNQNSNTTDSSVAKNRALTQLSSASDFITVISEVGDSVSKVLEREEEEKKKEKRLNEDETLQIDHKTFNKSKYFDWTEEELKYILSSTAGSGGVGLEFELVDKAVKNGIRYDFRNVVRKLIMFKGDADSAVEEACSKVRSIDNMAVREVIVGWIYDNLLDCNK